MVWVKLGGIVSGYSLICTSDTFAGSLQCTVVGLVALPFLQSVLGTLLSSHALPVAS